MLCHVRYKANQEEETKGKKTFCCGLQINLRELFNSFWLLDSLKSFGLGHDVAIALFYDHDEAGWKARRQRSLGGAGISEGQTRSDREVRSTY